jgi:hypothetical protein
MNVSDQNRFASERYPIQLEPLSSTRDETKASPASKTGPAPARQRHLAAVLWAAIVALADVAAVACAIWWLSR